MNQTINKLNGIINEMANTEDKQALKAKFCNMLTGLLYNLQEGESVASQTLAEFYLPAVKSGDYIKAVDCLTDLEEMNHNHFF